MYHLGNEAEEKSLYTFSTDETIETFGGPNIPQQGRNIFPPNIFNLRLVETSDAAPSDVEG